MVDDNYQEKRFGVSLIMLQNFLIFFLALFGEISGQDWDGVVVTESDYQSLQALKHELVDPNGVLRSWNDSGLGACSGEWIGIKCAQGQVIVIQLPWRGLSGRLTEKIGQFQALRKLSFHDNSIGGAIPTSLGFLPYLRGVQLFNNRFSGSIPASLGLCPLLQSLELGNNSLSEVIPESLVNSTKLIRLSLGYNLLTGPIPESFAQSPSLVFLDLERNNLSGPIPDSWGSSGKVSFQLQTLILSHNQFTGSFPGSIGNLKGLRSLDLSDNSFNGSFPGNLFDNLKNLSLLNLSNNKFQGQIPGAVGELPSLKSFNISYNNLSGPVPLSLSQNFNSSAFAGNPNLCGYTPSIPCSLSHPPQPSPSSSRRKLNTKDIILIVAGVLLIILLITCCILICCLLQKRHALKEVEEGQATQAKAAAGTGRGKKAIPPGAAEVEPSGGKLVHFDGNVAFTADDLLCATAEILGKSTYGTVYKATMGDGIQVAVKRLREKITRGQRDFEAYANALGEVRHPNLVPLRAYYFGPKGEKLLVFDYMLNGSLATFLHAREHGISLNWARRIKIIKDMARGLLHLHRNDNIIHGNLTSSNVLLDDKVNAKIGDFGLSRLMMEVANANVVATAGALGYRAPELSKLKKATTKSDVYSFGVIMLELLTGKSPAEEAMDGLDLPRWVASIVKEEWTNEVFDVELMKDASAIGDELLNVLKLAMHCVDPTPSARPEVEEILQQLEEIVAESSGGVESESPVD